MDIDLTPCPEHVWVIQSISYQPFQVYVTCLNCLIRGFIKDNPAQAFLPSELIDTEVFVYPT